MVSVVVPNYNYARYLPQVIRSILAQTYTELEIIVINNGSTDNSLEALKEFEGKIRVVSQENRGQSGARNRGILESTGEYVAFCDADDVWLPQKIEKQICLIEKNPNAGLVYTGYQTVDENLCPRETILPFERGRILQLFSKGAATPIPGGESTVLIRRECFDVVGLFDTELSISAGFDMYRRIASRYEIEVVPEALMLYRQHGSNASFRIDIFEHDILHALSKMFRDPASAEVHEFKKSSYAHAFLAISGAYLHSKKYRKAFTNLIKAAVSSPKDLSHATQLPLRMAKRMIARQGK